jgi:hypothetical protein
MHLEVQRFSSAEDDTLGNLFISDSLYKWLCFTLEDQKQTKKVYGETRIPPGTYEIKLKKVGGFHNRYLKQYGSDWHKGMLHIQNVPGFTDILIHKGNDDEDTAGCLLLGEDAKGNFNKKGGVVSSKSAYDRIYPIIRDKLLSGERVRIRYRNLDTL